MSNENSPQQERSEWRYFPCAIFFIGALLLFIGGTAAFLYWVFSEYSGVRNIWLLACGAPIVVVVLLIFTIYTLYSRYGRPLRQILQAIDSVAEGNLTVRVPDDNSPQFGELIKRFNKMVSDLGRSEQQRRNLTADIAHELRTPLHIIQGNLEGLVDGVYQPTSEHINATLDETRLLTRLVNDLQTLSLAETGQLPLHPARFRLADLIQDLTSSFSAQAAAQGVDLKTNVSNLDQQLTADYDRLNQVYRISFQTPCATHLRVGAFPSKPNPPRAKGEACGFPSEIPAQVSHPRICLSSLTVSGATINRAPSGHTAGWGLPSQNNSSSHTAGSLRHTVTVCRATVQPSSLNCHRVRLSRHPPGIDQ